MLSKAEKQREAAIAVMKKIADLRFDVEMLAIEYGDSSGLLFDTVKDLTSKMQSFGNEFLITG